MPLWSLISSDKHLLLHVLFYPFQKYSSRHRFICILQQSTPDPSLFPKVFVCERKGCQLLALENSKTVASGSASSLARVSQVKTEEFLKSSSPSEKLITSNLLPHPQTPNISYLPSQVFELLPTSAPRIKQKSSGAPGSCFSKLVQAQNCSQVGQTRQPNEARLTRAFHFSGSRCALPLLQLLPWLHLPAEATPPPNC